MKENAPTFESKKDFLEQFNLEKTDFFDPILLTDTSYGFSVKRKYPTNIVFKPALKCNGEPDTVAALWVVLDIANAIETRIPLTIRILTYSLWNAKHFFSPTFPPENDENAPTEESLIISDNTKKPETLFSRNEYFYNTDSKIFVTKKGKEIKAVEILERLFEEHCQTVHPIKGANLRCKKFIQKLSIKLLAVPIGVLKWTLYHVFYYETLGDPIDDKNAGLKNLVTRSTKTIKIFDYEAAKSTILIFSSLVVLCSLSEYFNILQLKYLKSISNDNFLILANTIAAIALIEIFPKLVIIPLLNVLVKTRARIEFWAINPFTYKLWIYIGIIMFLIMASIFVTISMLSVPGVSHFRNLDLV